VNWDRVDQVRGLRGIRIEDDVLINASGAEVLTAGIPKRIDEIETIAAAREPTAR
jgi:Xaa-Pro aminopeptidase